MAIRKYSILFKTLLNEPLKQLKDIFLPSINTFDESLFYQEKDSIDSSMVNQFSGKFASFFTKQVYNKQYKHVCVGVKTPLQEPAKPERKKVSLPELMPPTP